MALSWYQCMLMAIDFSCVSWDVGFLQLWFIKPILESGRSNHFKPSKNLVEGLFKMFIKTIF